MTGRRAPGVATAPDATRDAPARNDAPRPTWEIVELGAMTELLARDARRGHEARAARSLFQTSALGAVLTSVRAGGIVHNEHPDEAATIQGIQGECLISVDGTGGVIEPGTLVAIPAGIHWRLVARSDAVILLTIAAS